MIILITEFAGTLLNFVHKANTSFSLVLALCKGEEVGKREVFLTELAEADATAKGVYTLEPNLILLLL